MLLEILLWIIIIGLFITSFVALVFPVLPSVLAVWGGFLLYHFFLNPNELTGFFWVSMAAITAILLLSDVFVSSYTVKKFGGSKWGERAATIAVIVGTFVYPPFGILILPFVAVLLVETFQQKEFSQALRAAAGSLIGFLSSKLAEGILQVIMIGWFFLSVWF